MNGKVVLKWTLEKQECGVDWSHLSEVREQCRDFVNTVMNLRVPGQLLAPQEGFHSTELVIHQSIKKKPLEMQMQAYFCLYSSSQFFFVSDTQ
jgi:hypothetical protein